MTLDIKKLDEALKFIARSKNMSLGDFLLSNKLDQRVIHYLKQRKSTSLKYLEGVFTAAGLNPTSFIFTTSPKYVPFNPVTDLVFPEKLVTKRNLKLFFKYLVYTYGEYILSLSFIHKFLSNEFPSVNMNLLLYGDKQHACIIVELSKDKEIYIYLRMYHNKLYSCLSDKHTPKENLNKLAYDVLTYKNVLKYMKIIDLNTTLIKTI